MLHDVTLFGDGLIADVVSYGCSCWGTGAPHPVNLMGKSGQLSGMPQSSANHQKPSANEFCQHLEILDVLIWRDGRRSKSRHGKISALVSLGESYTDIYDALLFSFSTVS